MAPLLRWLQALLLGCGLLSSCSGILLQTKGPREGEDSAASLPLSAAVMVIGRTMDAGFSHQQYAHMVDFMTGAEEWEPAGEAGFEKVWPPVRIESEPHTTWASSQAHLIEPLNASLGGAVDVYVCTDQVRGALPKGIAAVRAINAWSQDERARLCYEWVESLPGAPRYDFFVKTRPDFFFVHDFPDIRRINQHRLHSRFRLANGIAGLTSRHFSWDCCSEFCNGQPRNATGYMADDMVYVVPRQIAPRAFAPAPLLTRREQAAMFKAPPTWIERYSSYQEDAFTARLLLAGVLCEPLAVVGYPTRSNYHHEINDRCRDVEVGKTQCGEQRPIEEVNKDLADWLASATDAAVAPAR